MSFSVVSSVRFRLNSVFCSLLFGIHNKNLTALVGKFPNSSLLILFCSFFLFSYAFNLFFSKKCIVFFVLSSILLFSFI